LIGGAIAWGARTQKSRSKAALAQRGGDVAKALLVGPLDRGEDGDPASAIADNL